MIVDEEIFLEHFGIKGMKWGVHKTRTEGVSRAVDREARKDASEFARAKVYFGEGAGTRRKLINQTISAKEKRLPGYRKALDNHLNNQDMSKHVQKAIKERNRTDRKNTTKKTAGAVARRITGEWGTSAAFVALAATGVTFVKSPQGKNVMQSSVSKVNGTSKYAVDFVKRKINAAKIKKML